jgi:hypothetical protein
MLQYTASDNAVSSLPDGKLKNSNKYFENNNGNLQLKQNTFTGINNNNCLILKWNGQNKIVGR